MKISTIYSQISALAREHTIDVLCDRLELLFRAAAKAKFKRRDGTTVPKFVYLDMEEYRDKELTAEVFMRTLDRPGLEQARAGIALQAYIPDSFATQQRINEWARRRVAAGGSPVTIRLVKGANMEAERVEASLRGWPQAPYKTKLETDANYLRMLHEGMRPENLAAVRLGIASHNLFTLAYGLVLATEAQCARPRAIRNARRHGQPPAPCALRADRQHAALCAGLQAGRFHQRHRLPGPPARRKHRPGQFPAARLQHRSRQPRVERRSNSSSSKRSNARDTCQQRTATHARSRSGARQRAESQERLITLDNTRSSAERSTAPSIPQRTRHRLVAAA